MDMVTQIEVEDAVRVYGKVALRVRAVAWDVASIHGTLRLEREEQPSWHMDAFTIQLDPPRAGMEHLRELAVRTSWSTKVGDEDDSYRRLTRVVQFPAWYLTGGGWEEREARKARNHRRLLARHNLEHARKAVDDNSKRQAALEQQLKDLTRLAAEGDEAV